MTKGESWSSCDIYQFPDYLYLFFLSSTTVMVGLTNWFLQCSCSTLEECVGNGHFIVLNVCNVNYSVTEKHTDNRQKYISCFGLFPCLLSSGTGVVTSVPSDAPDDIAALRDIKKKQVRTLQNKSVALKHWKQSSYETCGGMKILKCFNKLCSLVRLLCYLLKFRWTKLFMFKETSIDEACTIFCSVNNVYVMPAFLKGPEREVWNWGQDGVAFWAGKPISWSQFDFSHVGFNPPILVNKTQIWK